MADLSELQKVILILNTLQSGLSIDIRTNTSNALAALEKQAKLSTNKMDDLFVQLLRNVLGL